MTRLAILGASDLGQLLAHHAITDGHFELAGFFDDYRTPGELVGLGRVLGGLEDVTRLHASGAFDVLLTGIGYKHFGVRRAVFERFSATVPFARLVHSSCYVDPSAVIGAGAVLLPGCVVDRQSHIGENALLNTGCVVAHDSAIGAHGFLGPAVRIAGLVRTDPCVFLGIGTTVIDNITIASGVRTGGGTVVTKHLSDPGLYVGAPARLVRSEAAP